VAKKSKKTDIKKKLIGRSYTQAAIKELFVLSRNRCAVPKCDNEIIDSRGTNLGKIAHIVGLNENSARYKKGGIKNKNHVSNLILICSICHDKVDDKKREKEFTTPKLIKWKKVHQSESLKMLSMLGKISNNWKGKKEAIIPKNLISWRTWKKHEDENGEQFIRETLELFSKKLSKLPGTVRETFCDLIESGFHWNITPSMQNNKSIRFDDYILGFEEKHQQEKLKHLKVLDDHGWIQLQYRDDDENEIEKIAFPIKYGITYIDIFWEMILKKANSKKNLLSKIIVDLNFGI
jgi:hypothetical protein